MDKTATAWKPVWDIQIGPTASQSRVLMNGEDISSLLRGVIIEMRGGDLPKVTLEVMGHRSLTRLNAALDGVTVKIVDATADDAKDGTNG